MGRLIKYVFYLIIIILIGLVGYSFFGDLSTPSEDFKKEIQIPTAGT